MGSSRPSTSPRVAHVYRVPTAASTPDQVPLPASGHLFPPSFISPLQPFTFTPRTDVEPPLRDPQFHPRIVQPPIVGGFRLDPLRRDYEYDHNGFYPRPSIVPPTARPAEFAYLGESQFSPLPNDLFVQASESVAPMFTNVPPVQDGVTVSLPTLDRNLDVLIERHYLDQPFISKLVHALTTPEEYDGVIRWSSEGEYMLVALSGF